MENSRKLCPNCNGELAPAGKSRTGEDAYQCGHCLLRGGSIREMTKTAIEKKKRVEANAPLFRCKLCGNLVPSTKINIGDTFPDGVLEMIHVCDKCLPITYNMEAKRKIRNQEACCKDMTSDKWEKWMKSFSKDYPYLGQIKEILRKENKID